MERRASWQSRPRLKLSTLLLGILLVAAPTPSALFPVWRSWSLPYRALLLVGWLGVALYVVSGATRTDERVKELLDQKADELTDLSRLGLERTLSALLGSPERYFPRTFSATVFVFDSEKSVLLPFFPDGTQDPEDVRAFRPGNGATGTAWERKDFIVVTGDAVSDESYGLTAAQQEHFRDYRTVVACPIFEPTGKTAIGALTAISREDDRFFENDGAKERFKELADVIGLVVTKL